MVHSLRQRDILKLARAAGWVEVEDLAQRFEVSAQTIRRDLAEQNNQPVDTGKIADEKVDLTMFNGHANQYLFAPLQARVGERVRFWVLDAGPNRASSFHVVGAQFDTVFKEGAYLLRRDDPGSGGSQALDLASCQGGFVETVFTEPGRYTFVNHSFAQMERGARGLIRVE